MRPLLAALGMFGLVAVVVLAAGRAMGAFEAPERVAPPIEARAPAEVKGSGAGRSKRSAKQKSAGRVQGAGKAPREQLVVADVALARKAVLQPGDLAPPWRAFRAPEQKAPGCPANAPDLSRFTITGRASSAFKTGRGGQTYSEVTVFANAGQAALYFEATSNRTVLGCIRDGVKRNLNRSGFDPTVMYARLLRQPPVGAQTTHYVLAYAVKLPDGTRQEYPVDVLTFRAGRAVGALAYNFVFSPDGSRPCTCELVEARLVAGRLLRS